jgi:hypothetical protein
MKLRIARKILRNYAKRASVDPYRISTFYRAVCRVTLEEYCKYARLAMQTLMRERQK